MEPIQINPTELEMIGSGDEGIVYNYHNKYAVKIFTKYRGLDKKAKLCRKMSKVEEMTSFHDPAFAYPYGLANTDGINQEGYYTELFHFKNSLASLKRHCTPDQLRAIFLKAEDGMKRAHRQGIVLGDIKEDNIMLRENGDPVWIDTDNYKFGKHHFDLIPFRAGTFYKMYGGRVLDFKDNDILVFSIMSMGLLTKDKRFDVKSTSFDIRDALAERSLDKETKEILDCIFSDAENKPYIGKVLEKIR